jgi:hypothetical protein
MEAQERKQLYLQARADLLVRQLSNNEKLDAAILTLASAALALSVTFLSGGFSSNYLYLLVLAWLCLCLAIISTLVSFHSSQLGIARQLVLAERYYLDNDETALTEKNVSAELTEKLAYGSTVLFVLGVCLLLAYFGCNITRLENRAVGDNQVSGRENVDSAQKANAGASVPRLQVVPGSDQRGASVPPITPVQPASEPKTPPSPPSSPSKK